MRRDQLEHAIRTACQIIGHPAVIVVGSQSILGTFDEDELPESAHMSREVDILPMGEDTDEVSIDGVDLTTSALPDGWRDRLVEVQNSKHRGARWTAGLCRLVSGQGGSLRGEDVCLP